MPCYDSRDHRPYLKDPEELEAIQKELNKRTRMLCEVLTVMEKMHPQAIEGFVGQLSRPTLKWWKEHKEFDKKKKE